MTQPRSMPDILLQTAAVIMKRQDAAWRGSWPRAAALLTRQALEDGVDLVWTGALAPLKDASMRAQMVCLPRYLGDSDLARDTYVTWCALSNACHAHPFDLAPTAQELRGWGEVVRKLLDQVAAASLRASPQTPY